jgi:hypothetical protein
VAIVRGLGVRDVMVQVHWKRGPHVDLLVRCDARRLHEEVLPAVRPRIVGWLQEHPSTTPIDANAYESLSKQIGLVELEPGPYIPLLKNNTITLVPYEPSRALRLPELVQAKERFLSATLDLTLQILDERSRDGDACLAALGAMMAALGETYEVDGLARGYVSFRSHAEYFFAASDAQAALRPRFDALDAKLGPCVDACVRGVLADAIDTLPLSATYRAAVVRWREVIGETATEVRGVVRANHARLLADTTFDELVEAVRPNATVEYRERMARRETSVIGRRFLEEDEGRRVMASAEFMSYRTCVNFFYLLLPILGISPIQKFCLCHIVANSVERVLGVSWQRIMGMGEVGLEARS